MSEVVAAGSWCVTATTSPRFELSSLLVEKSFSKNPLHSPTLGILFQQEIVPLRKICRRPETDYRLQQLHSAANDFANSKPAPDAAAKAPLPPSTASAPIVPPDVKDPSLSAASATSAQPSSNAATVPAGSA